MATSDEDMFRRYSQELAAAIDAHIEGWIASSVRERLDSAGIDRGADIDRALAAAATSCRADVAAKLSDLFAADIDDQHTTPLAVIRSCLHHAAGVLAGAGVAPVERDEFERRSFPGDLYGLNPSTMADIHESLAEPALVWGAAKAHIHRSRHG